MLPSTTKTSTNNNNNKSLSSNSIFLGIIFVIVMSSCKAISVAEFGARACVQKSLQSPHSVASVLSFFYGVDYHSSGWKEQMRHGSCMKGQNDMGQLWYFGGPEYDKLCQPFAPVVRAAGRNEFLTTTASADNNNKAAADNDNVAESSSSLSAVDGYVAQMLLCDQFARNIFRGTNEAFAYTEQALEACRTLARSVVMVSPDTDKAAGADAACLSGELYPPYLSFMVVALMHSESAADHEQGLQLLDYAEQQTKTNTASSADADELDHLHQLWKFQRQFTVDHKAVVDRFGRYPHRNKAMGRKSTAEEEVWLADTENLPGWAKSQM